MSDKKTGKWLNKAIELEKKGHEFYKEAASKAKDADVVNFFKFMAEQELIHVKIIKKIFENLNASTPWAEAGTQIDDNNSDLKNLFIKLTKSKPSSDDDILKAVDGGIHFETEVKEFYEAEMAAALDNSEKKFLSLMVAEENSHRQVLADMKLFLTDPESWSLNVDNMHLDGA